MSTGGTRDRASQDRLASGLTLVAARTLCCVASSRLTLLAAVTLCAACPPASVARPYPPPTGNELIAALRARVTRAGSMRTERKVDYLEERGERIKLTMTFLVAAPDHLRIDAESPLGGSTVASLASDGQTFQLLDVEHNRFLAGNASPCNIARLIRVQLAPSDVVAVLAGGAPLPVDAGREGGPAASVAWAGEDGGREVLTLTSAEAVETVKLTPRDKGWDVTSVRVVGSDGKVRYALDNEDFSDGDPHVPGRTHIEEPARGVDVRMRLKDVERGVKAPDGAFHLDAPTGIELETVTCG